MTAGSVLEARYRRLLRVLPADYRRAWADEMTATFLESMRVGDPEVDDYLADFGRPPRAEVLSVLALAVRLRLGAGGASPRYAAWGAAVRRLALLGLLANAAFGLAGVGFRLWSAGELPVLPPPPAGWLHPMPSGLLPVAAQLSGLLWLPAYLALVFGQWRAARAVAALALLPAAGGALLGIARQVGGEYPGPPLTESVGAVTYLLFDTALVLALTAYATGAPPARRRWLLALPAALAGAGLVLFAAWPFRAAVYLLDWAGIWCLVTVVAALAWAVAGRPAAPPPGGSGAADPWPLALAVLAGGVLALRVLTTLAVLVSDLPDRAAWLWGGLAGAAAVTAAGAPLAVRAARSTRRLPAVPAAGVEP
jgi:hypothetical protein